MICLKCNEEHPEYIPFVKIVVTGTPGREDDKTVRTEGMAPYVCGPIDLKMKEALDKAFNNGTKV